LWFTEKSIPSPTIRNLSLLIWWIQRKNQY
jgi:hypothetical protein